MSAPSSFYTEQAAICAKSAEDTALPQLREKYLRSQAAWEALAERESGIKAARAIRARRAGEDPDPDVLYPTVKDGLDGMRFIAAAVASSRDGSVWTRLA